MVDSSDNKYKSWVFTIQAVKGSTLPGEQTLVRAMTLISQRYVFQLEKATSLHYQGCCETRIRKRQRTLLNEIVVELDIEKSQVTLSPMQGTWDQAKAYCTKSDTSFGPVFTNEILYDKKDIEVLEDPAKRFPWQNSVFDILFDKNTGVIKTADDRSIFWIEDSIGATGKSKFIKFCCVHYDSVVKISFGTSTQLRSSIIAAGPRLIYFIDIPRTLGSDDSIPSLMSALEDLKNGFVVSSMYGKNETLVLNPPHIVVFTNKECPRHMMSADRWQCYFIDPSKHLYKKDEEGLWVQS
jgi:hypothetical protein